MVVLAIADMKNNWSLWPVLLLIGLISLVSEIEAGIFDDLKNSFPNTDLVNNLQQALSDIKTNEGWEALDEEYFSKLSEENVNNILRNGQGLADRTKAQLKSQLATLDTDVDSIISKIRSASSADSEVAILAENLKRENWDENFINKLGTEPLKKIGNGDLLAAVTDPKAVTRMMNQAEALSRSEGDPAVKMKLEDLHDNLVDKLGDGMANFKEVDFRNFPIKKLTPEMIMTMDSNLVSLVNKTLADEDMSRTGCRFGRSIVKKLMESKLKSDSSFIEFSVFFDELGSRLQKYVFPEDMSPDTLNVEFIASFMRSNTRDCMKTGDASPKSRSLYRLNTDTTVTSAILNSEGTCGVGKMTLAAVNSSLELLNDGSLREMDNCFVGADQQAKRIAILLHHENKTPLTRNVAYSNLPDKVISFGTRFAGTQENEAASILRKEDVRLSDSQMEMLASKVRSNSISSLAAKAKASIPLARLQNMNTNELANIAKSMPGQSLPCLKAAMTIFGQATSISAQLLVQNKGLLRCMSRMDAKKLDTNTTPFEYCRQIKDEVISMALGMELRDRLVNATVSNNDRRAAVSKISLSDMDNIPRGVMATFGYDLEALSEKKREFLLMQLGKMKQVHEIPIQAQRNIVNLGLMTKKREDAGGSLMPGDLALVGQAFMQITPNMLRKAATGTKMRFLNRINDDIKMGKLNIFCITSGMRDAIAKIIEDVYGAPHMLDSMIGIDCLMWAPSWNYLQSVPKEVLDDANCKLPDANYASIELAEGNCLDASDMYFGNPKQMEEHLQVMQAKRLIQLMEEETDMGGDRDAKKLELSPCEKGAILGVDNMKSRDLSQMTSEEVIECMQYLGMMDMSASRAKSYIIDKVLPERGNDPARLTEMDITKLRSAFKGFSPDQISKMNSNFFRPTNEVVRTLGTLNLDKSQVEAVAAKIKSRINSLATLTKNDLMSLGNIMCGFSEADLKEISYQSAQDVVPMLKRLKCDGSNLDRAMPAIMSRIYGKSENMDEAKMKDIGVLATNMDSEYFRQLEPKAYAGITPTAMRRISSQSIGQMNARGIENLQYETAAAMSQYQVNSLSGDQRKALDDIRSMGGSPPGSTASLVFVSLSMLITIFL